MTVEVDLYECLNAADPSDQPLTKKERKALPIDYDEVWAGEETVDKKRRDRKRRIRVPLIMKKREFNLTNREQIHLVFWDDSTVLEEDYVKMVKSQKPRRKQVNKMRKGGRTVLNEKPDERTAISLRKVEIVRQQALEAMRNGGGESPETKNVRALSYPVFRECCY